MYGGLIYPELISIHAPTRGATVIPGPAVMSHIISIHAPTRGATFQPSVKAVRNHLFQSTLPQGERHLQMSRDGLLDHFNPRSHKGSDRLTVHSYQESSEISIHAPTRGATAERIDSLALEEFQSTLPQGERQQFYTKFHICFISFLPILSPYHISTHSPLPTFNHFLYIFSGANRPGISCLLPFRTKTISGIL